MLLKAGSCVLLTMSLLGGVGRAQEVSPADVATKLEAMQAKIDGLEARQPKLRCKQATSSMTAPMATNMEAQVHIPPRDLEAGYKLTGGGCYILRPVNMLRRSSATATEDGWRCELVDIPEMQFKSSVQASVIYCKVEQ